MKTSEDSDDLPGGVSVLFENGKKPNLLFIITDQERAIQHWPEDFIERHLPARKRLQQHGLTMDRFYSNACMCSPSRATLLTSQFPAVTGVTRTGSPEPKVWLPTPAQGMKNLATVLNEAGYHSEWHGKWHLGGHPSDYGFHGWEPPDAGNYLSLNDTLGGGTPDNDGRFLKNMIQFLQSASVSSSEQPFCLVASFVNPHDVYVAQTKPTFGYTSQDFDKVHVPLPSNIDEDLSLNNKPRAQSSCSYTEVPFENAPRAYVNFYAYLHTVVDAQIGAVLDALELSGLIDETLIIRTADHGEQGLSHGLVEKFYNVYEESIRVPMVVSNPVAFPQPSTRNILASHVDIIPTLLELLGIEKPNDMMGSSLAPIWNGNASSKPLHHFPLHFTYDDIPSRKGPSTIRCLISDKYKYAVYFQPDGSDADWELYHLRNDPLEDDNLAGTKKYAPIQARLDAELVNSMKRNRTFPMSFLWPPKSTKDSVGVAGTR
jgi:choline-sulfatase